VPVPPLRLQPPSRGVGFSVMPGSLRLRLPALFLLGIVLAGVVAALIAVQLFQGYTRSRSFEELGREASGIARLYGDAALRATDEGTPAPDFAPDALELATGDSLLRAPLAAGSEYQGDFGRVRITRVGFASRVQAGEYADCLETVDTLVAGTSSRVTTTVFCAGAGIVSRRSEADSDEGQASESMELKSAGRKVVLVP